MALTVGELVAYLRLNDTEYNAKLAAAEGKLTRFGKKTSAIGSKMMTGVTLPVLAAGAASVYMATKFDDSMTLIQTQAGGSAKDVKYLTDAVLKMKDVQHSPQQLADSLYHLKSVGMGNVAAMKALTAAEHLASVGQADLEQTTNAVAGAYKSGIQGAQDFNQAAATINATIGAGNLRMDDLTSAMGTGFLVTAKQYGISLIDVGSALATMTARGIPAVRGATAIKMALSGMAAPTSAAQKIMAKLGIGVYDLANAMRKGGLPAAFAVLQKHLQGLSLTKQTAALQGMFGAKSSQAILTLLGNLKDYKKVQDQVISNATSGKFQAATAAQAKTAGAQFAMLKSNLAKLGVEFGTMLLPAALKVAGMLKKFVDWLAGLSSGQKKMVATFAVIAAAIGPVLVLIGKMSTGVSAILKMWGAIAKMISGSATAQEALNAATVTGGESRTVAGVGTQATRVFQVGSSGAGSTVIGQGEKSVATSLESGGAGVAGAGGGAAAVGGASAGVIAGVVVVGAAAGAAIGAAISVPLEKYVASHASTAASRAAGATNVPGATMGPFHNVVTPHSTVKGMQAQMDALTKGLKAKLTLDLQTATSAKEIADVSAKLQGLDKLTKMKIDLGDVKTMGARDLDSLVQQIHRVTGLGEQYIKNMLTASGARFATPKPPDLTPAQRAFQNMIAVARKSGGATAAQWERALQAVIPAGQRAAAGAVAAIMAQLNKLPAAAARVAKLMAQDLVNGINTANSASALSLEQQQRRIMNSQRGGGGTGRPPAHHASQKIGGRASGGYVPRTPGGTILRVGEGKYDEVIAQVLPRGGGQGVGSGPAIHITIGHVIGTDSASARNFANTVANLVMAKQRQLVATGF